MRQVFLLDMHDLAGLKRGDPLLMQFPGGQSDIWLKSGCGTHTNNTKGSTAEDQLTPKEQKLPPPSARGVAPKPWVAR
jgi:hypothetical protein